MGLNKFGQCIKLRSQRGIIVFLIGSLMDALTSHGGKNIFIYRVDPILQNPWEGKQRLQVPARARKSHCEELCVMSSSSKSCPLQRWAMPGNHFPGIFQWTSVPIMPPHIFLELFIPWLPAAGPAFEQETIPLPGTGCTLVHKDRGWDQRLRSNQLFLHGKHFTLHSLSIAEEPGSLQPKEFIAHSFLNLI